MKVFISWSGDLSRSIAEALRDWIPSVIQEAKPFVSSQDIEAGQRWSDVIGSQLNEAGYGIICITNDNLAAPWLHFEAGAISKALNKSFVSPFLFFDVKPGDVRGPLAQFQFTPCDRTGVLNLMRSINQRLEEGHQLSDQLLRGEFEKWWSTLETALNQLLEQSQKQPSRTHTGYPWLYLAEDLAAALRDAHCDEVWVITPDLYDNVLAMPLKEVIQSTLVRGVTYKVMIPKSDDSDTVKGALTHLGGGKTVSIQVRDFPHDDFQSAAVTDYLITNPGTGSMQVFLKVPVAVIANERGYWIKAIDQAADSLYRRFGDMMQRQPVQLP